MLLLVLVNTITKNNYCCDAIYYTTSSTLVCAVCMPSAVDLMGVHTMVIVHGNHKSCEFYFDAKNNNNNKTGGCSADI